MKKLILLVGVVILLSSCAVSRKPISNLHKHHKKQQAYYTFVQTVPYTYKVD